MQQDTLDVLRHINVHGTRTRAEVVKAFPNMPTAGKAVDNLAMLGYLADEGTTTPKTYIVTKKAKDKIAKQSTPWKPRGSSGLHALQQAVVQHGAGQRTEPPRAHRSTATRIGSYHSTLTDLQVYGPIETRAIKAAVARVAYVPKPWEYQPTEFAPSTRPGAMAAFEKPSRMGNSLRWPDGRVTDIDGNPITTP